MSTNACRWGILGAANIARKNWQAIRDAGNATLVAVASRNVSRAQQFIDECHAQIPLAAKPQALGDYEALIARKDIDALYIPLPTGLRKQWVIRAANAGKHVLVEKPTGITAADVREMIAACEANKVQFMDGVMFMHSTRLPKLREMLDDGRTVGDIRRITTQFTFNGGDDFMQRDIRTSAALEPAGCLGDLGWYCIRFSLWAMRYEMPQSVTARVHQQSRRSDSAGAVPVEMSGDLWFRDGISASFHCSFISHNSEWATITGTRGFVHVPDFVLPFSGSQTRIDVTQSEFVLRGCQFDMHRGRSEVLIDEPSSNAPGSQESEMFRTFSDLVLSGKHDPQWAQITLQTQLVMDACLHSAQQHGAPVIL